MPDPTDRIAQHATAARESLLDSMTASGIEWVDPPKPGQSKADIVAAHLRSNPGKWAKIATTEGLEFCPWWTPIYNSDQFETQIVGLDGKLLFGKRDIYARFRTEAQP